MNYDSDDEQHHHQYQHLERQGALRHASQAPVSRYVLFFSYLSYSTNDNQDNKWPPLSPWKQWARGRAGQEKGRIKIGKKYLHLELCDKLIYVVIYYYNLNWNFSFDPLVQ